MMELAGLLAVLAIVIIMSGVAWWLVWKLRGENAALREEVAVAEMTRQHHEESISQAADNVADLRRKLEEAEGKVQDLRLELSEVNTKFLGIARQFEDNKQQNAKLEEERGAQLSQISTLQCDNRELQTTLANERKRSENLAGEKQTLTVENRRLADELADTHKKLAAADSKNASLAEVMNGQEKHFQELRQASKEEFQNLANRILTDNSQKFAESNQTGMKALIEPLQKDIAAFRQAVADTHDKETAQYSRLDERIKNLVEQTQIVSTEANNLATALKGKAKMQGDWGETILKRVLECAGLAERINYETQKNVKNEIGHNYRPDMVVNLPEGRSIIIDSKVSLTAYTRYCDTEDRDEQQKALTEHIESVRKHIAELDAKHYENFVPGSIDFTLMFIPIEPAYLLAMKDGNLWAEAYKKHVIIVSACNLIACLRIVEDLWRHDDQERNARVISENAKKIYEKLVSFTRSFESIGNCLLKASESFDDAKKQLCHGRGNMTQLCLNFKKLGVKTDKTFPDSIQKEIEMDIADNDFAVESDKSSSPEK